jgi:hypothetical protein
MNIRLLSAVTSPSTRVAVTRSVMTASKWLEVPSSTAQHKDVSVKYLKTIVQYEGQACMSGKNGYLELKPSNHVMA